ncbi:MAG TPA: hypothetical protein PLH94_03835 [Fimbriimonadaceae bacterium]|nr:hypothetical protein [Fimbriimonadaceae bacterium]
MKARFGLMVWCLLPGLAVAQLEDPALDKKVTFLSRAARMPVLLDVLSKHTELTFKTVPAMEDEVVVVDVRDLPLRDLLDKLAEQTLGEWSRADGAWYLGKSSAKVREREKEARTRKIEVIKKSIALRARDLQEGFTADAIQKRIEEGRKLDLEDDARFDMKRYRRQEALSRQLPLARALSRLILKLDPGMLADLKTGDRLVLSSHPTPMQRALPAGTGPILASLVEEQRNYAAVVAALPEAPGGEMTPFHYTPKKPFKKPPARILLILTGVSYNETPQAKLSVFDEQGKALGDAEDEFDDFRFEDEAVKRPDPPANLDPTPIEFTSESRDYAGALQKTRERKAGDLPDIAPEWLERIARPDLHEPLSYATTDLVLQMARSKKAQLALAISDAYGLSFSQFPAGKKAPTVGELAFFLGADVVNGWFTLRPPVPIREPERTGREALARFVADIREKGRVTLDGLAQFALAGDAPRWRLATMIVSAFTPELSFNWWDKGNIDAIRLYGTFTPQQRVALSGPGVPFPSLAPGQKSLVHRLIFGADASVSVTEDEENPEAANPDESFDEEMFFLGVQSWSDEPTNALPRGIPLDAKITLTSKTGPVIFPSDSTSGDRGYYIWAVDPDSLASSMAYRERPDLFPWATEQPNFDLFRVADRETATIGIDPRPGVSAEYPLNDDTMQTKGRGVSFKELPSAVREQIEKMLVKHRESFKDMKPGDYSSGGGRKRPPPQF